MDDAVYATPAWYFEHVLLENLKEFQQDQCNPRLAFNAAVSNLSMRDWMLESCSALPAKYDDYLISLEPAFRIVADLANAAKHMTLRPRSRGLAVRSAADARLGAMTCCDPVNLSLTTLRVVCADGTEPAVLDVLSKVARMWSTELQRLGRVDA